MIFWLLQSAADHPDVARGIAPAGLLSGSEQARLASLKTEKRRHDWLLGRWTAKRLIQTYIERQTSLRPPLDALVIGSSPDGAPFLEIRDWGLGIGNRVAPSQSLIPNPQFLSLSISHSGDRALCALVEQGQVGVDVERVEVRSGQFAEDYFTAEEIRQVLLAPAKQRAMLISAIWSAKESVLKVLRLGLTVDTRSVSCSLAGPGRTDDWADVAFALDNDLLGLDAAPALIGWWRQVGDFVLTIAATRSERRGFEIDVSTDRLYTLGGGSGAAQPPPNPHQGRCGKAAGPATPPQPDCKAVQDAIETCPSLRPA